MLHHTPLRARRAIIPLSLVLGLAACGGAAELAADVPADPVAEAPADEPAEPADEPAEPDEEPTDAGSGGEVVTDPIDGQDGNPTTTGGDCSASALTAADATVVEVAGLPSAVADLRDFLLDAALRCDEPLLRTAIDESSMFTYSFGGGDDALAHWAALEVAGEAPWMRMVDVLGTTPALADGGDLWVWPAVTTGRPETRTPELLAELDWVDDGIRESVAAGEDYLGWRIGISTDGEWRFFVMGD